MRPIITHLQNYIGYSIRNKLQWQRGNYRENPNAIKQIENKKLIDHAMIKEGFYEGVSDKLYRKSLIENIVVYKILTSINFSDYLRQKKDILIVDIGSKNFSYAPTLERFFNSTTTVKTICGIEIDPYRVYSNLYSRFDCANYYCSLTKSAIFKVGDVSKVKFKADIVTWFSPFVLEESHLNWGLPKKLFSPVESFRQIERALEPDGLLIISNEFEEEWVWIQKHLPRLWLKLIAQTFINDLKLPRIIHPRWVSIWSYLPKGL